MSAARRCCSSRAAGRGRCLLAVRCTLLAAGQCWQLLQLFLSEPVSSTISLTPALDVQVPSVTICLRPLGNQSSPGQGNASYPEMLWSSLESLDATLAKCHPGCFTDVDVGFPGGSVPVKIGTWRSWMSSVDSTRITKKYRHRLCHTLEPNVTWGQLSEEYPGRSWGININLHTNRVNTSVNYGYTVAIHPRRRPVFFTHGIRGIRGDARFAVVEQKPVIAHVSKYILDRESLRRSACVTTPGYDTKTCMMNHFYSAWAKEKNCSWLETLQDFPQLTHCSRHTRGTTVQLSLHRLAYKAACPAACRQELITSVVTVSDISMDKSFAGYAMLRVIPGEVPERVNTERLSYRAVTMFSEMGGYISLLLGVSALSLADLVGHVFSWCRSAVGGRRRRVTSATNSQLILVKP